MGGVRASAVLFFSNNVVVMIEKIKTYFVESYHELKKVNWPTRQETIRLTIVVVIFSLCVAFFLGMLDIVFAYALRWFVL